MIPNVDILLNEIVEVEYPTRTYKINFLDTKSRDFITNTPTDDSNSEETSAILGVCKLGVMFLGGEAPSENSTDGTNRVSGYVDDLDAVVQAIYLILNTERYQFVIYSWDYGVELVDLFGKPMPYVMSELPRRITEALTQDDRITGCKDFEFEINKHKLHTTFTVITTMGDIPTELEVNV